MSEQNETIFVDGMMFKRPIESAPAFVKGSVSIKVDELIAFLQKHRKADGWVNCDLLASKDNSKLYFKLNTYVAKKTETETNDSALPTYKAPAAEPEVPEINEGDVPW